MDISARFVDLDEAALLRKQDFYSFPSGMGEVFIPQIPQSFAETVTLGMTRFLKRITVNGIYSA